MPKLFVYLDESDRAGLVARAAEHAGGNTSLLCRAYLMLGRAAWEMLDDRGKREVIMGSRRLGRSAGPREPGVEGLPRDPAEARAAS